MWWTTWTPWLLAYFSHYRPGFHLKAGKRSKHPVRQHLSEFLEHTAKRAWGKAEGGFGRLQVKQSSGESNNYTWVFTDITKGRIKVHRKFKLRLWESIWLFLNTAWMGQATVPDTFNKQCWRGNGRKQYHITQNFALEKNLIHLWELKRKPGYSYIWVIFSEHWHRICCE